MEENSPYSRPIKRSNAVRSQHGKGQGRVNIDDIHDELEEVGNTDMMEPAKQRFMNEIAAELLSQSDQAAEVSGAVATQDAAAHHTESLEVRSISMQLVVCGRSSCMRICRCIITR